MRKRKARRLLIIMGIMGGIITFLCGLIGCVFTDSMWKYLCMAALIAGFVLFFIWGGEQAILLFGEIAQLARAHGSYPWCRGFKSLFRYHTGFGEIRSFFLFHRKCVI